MQFELSLNCHASPTGAHCVGGVLCGSFLQGNVDKYAWVGKGGSFVMSEINAAVLHAQLGSRVMINAARMQVWDAYHAALEGLEAQGKLSRPVIPVECEHNAHIYYIRVKDAQGRANLDKLAKERSIGVFSHYQALHISPAAAKFARSMVCTEAAECASQLRRLPMWVGLSALNVDAVVALVHDALA